MLYPQMNAKRMLTQLSGFWKFAMDKENNGESKNWQNGISADHEVAVGASWNEHFQDLIYFFDTGWYEQTGRLDEVYEVFKKPIMITEFGADAVAGLHIDPPEAFSEEYQAEMVTRQYKIMEEKPYVMGAHIWAFADFKTSQTPSRVIVNRKGLFTRDRQPKLAAHMIRKEWTQN